MFYFNILRMIKRIAAQPACWRIRVEIRRWFHCTCATELSRLPWMKVVLRSHLWKVPQPNCNTLCTLSIVQSFPQRSWTDDESYHDILIGHLDQNKTSSEFCVVVSMICQIIFLCSSLLTKTSSKTFLLIWLSSAIFSSARSCKQANLWISAVNFEMDIEGVV